MTEPEHKAWRVLDSDGETSYTITAEGYEIKDDDTLVLHLCGEWIAAFRPTAWRNVVAVDAVEMLAACRTVPEQPDVLYRMWDTLERIQKAVSDIRTKMGAIYL